MSTMGVSHDLHQNTNIQFPQCLVPCAMCLCTGIAFLEGIVHSKMKNLLKMYSFPGYSRYREFFFNFFYGFFVSTLEKARLWIEESYFRPEAML